MLPDCTGVDRRKEEDLDNRDRTTGAAEPGVITTRLVLLLIKSGRQVDTSLLRSAANI